MSEPSENRSFTHHPLDISTQDPTARTLQTLQREIENVSERLEESIRAEARLAAERDQRFKEVQDERLLRIDQRFEERDERTDQIAQLGRISLDAALAAAKEAVGEQNKSNALSITKSESSMKEQINANSTQAMTRIDGQVDKVDGLTARIVAIEAGGYGRQIERVEQRADIQAHRMSTGQLTATISTTFLGFSVIISSILIFVHH